LDGALAMQLSNLPSVLHWYGKRFFELLWAYVRVFQDSAKSF